MAVNKACLALELGEVKAVLVAGAETAASAARVAANDELLKAYPAGGTKLPELDSWSDEQMKYRGRRLWPRAAARVWRC